MNDYYAPWFTQSWLIFVVFLVSLCALHVIFVRVWPLSSIRWKQVDYIWVSLAFIGILSSVERGQERITRTNLELAETRLEGASSMVRSAMDFGLSEAVCRRFATSETTPDRAAVARFQREYDEQCAWFKNLASQLVGADTTSVHSVLAGAVASKHPVGGEAFAYTVLGQAVDRYEKAWSDVERLNAEGRPSTLQDLLRFFGPVLLAIAVSLRLTKVTGEIALTRAG